MVAAQGLFVCWQKLQAAHDDFLQTQDEWLKQQPALAGTLRRIAIKTTARNQFAGVIDALDVGQPATAVFKAHAVMVAVAVT